MSLLLFPIIFLFFLFHILTPKIYHIYQNTTLNKIISGTSKANAIKPGDIFYYHKRIHYGEQYMTNLKGNSSNHILIKVEPAFVLENSS